MANTVTKAEREQLIATCRGHLERGMPYAEAVQVLLNQGISRDRARSAVAKAQRLMRGEEVKRKMATVRYGVNLEDASLQHVAAIERATGLSGASAVIRQALRRWAEEL